MMYFPLTNTVQLVIALWIKVQIKVLIKINNRLNCPMIMSITVRR